MGGRETYGSRMAKWEDEQDQRYFSERFQEAVTYRDYVSVEELIEEAKIFDYEIPWVSDPNVHKLLKKHGLEK